MFSACCSGHPRVLLFLSPSPQRCISASLFLHSGFRSLCCHRAGWGKEEFCFCGRALRRASLSYFTLILSDSHAVCFIVRRAFLELLHQAFLTKEEQDSQNKEAKCGQSIVPPKLCHAGVWSLPLLLSLWGVFGEPEESTEMHARSWWAMPGWRVELQFLLLSGEWGKHVP